MARIAVTRRRLDDGAILWTNASARSMRPDTANDTQDVSLRECTVPLPLYRKRACLNKAKGLCPGPWRCAVTREEYRHL
jgi:excinuclease UvrABC nuclease subunit